MKTLNQTMKAVVCATVCGLVSAAEATWTFDTKTNLLTAFSDGVKPYGLITAEPKNTWIVLRRTDGMMLIFK